MNPMNEMKVGYASRARLEIRWHKRDTWKKNSISWPRLSISWPRLTNSWPRLTISWPRVSYLVATT